MPNHTLKSAALWMTGRTLTLMVFVAVSLGSCAAINRTAWSVFYPAQTEFPGGVPPKYFLVVVEEPDSAGRLEHRILAWRDAEAILAKAPQKARLSVGEGRLFRVLEEGPGYQVVEARHRETAYIASRYRVEGGKITPLFYKVYATLGSWINLLMLPVAVLCFWLGLVAARRFLKFFSARTTRKSKTEGSIKPEPS